MIALDHPPLWLPPKPAIIRPADDSILRPSYFAASIPRHGRRQIIADLVAQGRLTREQGKRALVVGYSRASAIAPKVLTWQTSASDSSTQSTYTFTSQAIGTAATDRYVIVAINVGAASARTWSSGTIGGVTAALVSDGTHTATLTNGASTAFIIIALVPTGTTATIAYTLSGNGARSGIGVWSATGLVSATANHVQTSTANPGTDTLNVLAGGFAIGTAGNDNAGTTTWTNMTKRYDADTTGGLGRMQSGADATTSAGTLAITATRSASSAPLLIGASW